MLPRRAGSVRPAGIRDLTAIAASRTAITAGGCAGTAFITGTGCTIGVSSTAPTTGTAGITPATGTTGIMRGTTPIAGIMLGITLTIGTMPGITAMPIMAIRTTSGAGATVTDLSDRAPNPRGWGLC